MGGATYYVDAERGSDNSAGTSPRTAWKSIQRVNRTVYTVGDQVLFAAGQTFPGTLKFDRAQNGAPDKPILISSFGKGRARIDGGTADGFTLVDCSYVTVKNLDFVGSGRKNGSDGTGIRLLRTRHVTLDSIDVSGFRLAGVRTGGDADTRILRVRAHDNGSAGIETNGGSGDVPRSKRLYIGDCVVENNPGDPKNRTNHSGNGIVIGGVDGAVIEYCRASNNGWDMPRDGNGPVGIWAWNADRVTIQHCISYENKSPGADGGGFDFDGGVTSSVMQYNLSYDNQGTGYLLCQYPGAAPWRNNIIRYNISSGDGAKNLHSGIGLWIGSPGISDALVYNNTIVNPRHAIATLGAIPGFVYRNNILVAGDAVLNGDFHLSRFEHNLYWSTGKDACVYRDEKTAYVTLADWAAASGQEQVESRQVSIFADPRLVLPTGKDRLPTDPRKLAAMPFFRLRSGSPVARAGCRIPDNGKRDLFGGLLVDGEAPSLGAHEPARQRGK
jgi:hypothetical protein